MVRLLGRTGLTLPFSPVVSILQLPTLILSLSYLEPFSGLLFPLFPCSDIWQPGPCFPLQLTSSTPGIPNHTWFPGHIVFFPVSSPYLLLLLLLSRFSLVRLCATPETAAHRLPRPWDSPGKNTGVGCHFLLQCIKVKSEREVTQSCPTVRDPMDCSPPGSSIHGIFQARVLEWGAIAFSEYRV